MKETVRPRWHIQRGQQLTAYEYRDEYRRSRIYIRHGQNIGYQLWFPRGIATPDPWEPLSEETFLRIRRNAPRYLDSIRMERML